MKRIKWLLILLLIMPTFVLADLGPKPSITVYLKNIEGKDYLIDLLSDFKDRENLIEEIVEHYQDLKDHEIYKYHEDTWYATSLRNFLLWGDVQGNDEHVHKFTYFGVPGEFKVIIELPDGTIKVSKLIKKTSFDFATTIDVNDMSSVAGEPSPNYMKHFGILVLTIVIEVAIAFLFKTKKYGSIALVNFVTNTILQILMVNVVAFRTSLLYFISAEITILCAEGIVYLDTLKLDKKKIVLYTVVANVVTAILTFII